MIGLLGLLVAAADPAVFYTAPADPAARAPAAHAFPRHEPGTTLYAATDEANVRQSPAADAPVVTTLPMGSPVNVQEVRDGEDTVEARVDTWYRVVVPGAEGDNREGWVFGAALTPLVFRADWDQDGEDEVITVSLGWDFLIRVRVMEPGVTGKDRVQTVTLEPAGGAFLSQVGGRATAETVPAARAGLPLLHVVSAPEACADYSEAWVSYRSAGRGKAGKVRVALLAHGMMDPPVHSTFKVSFDARRKTALLTRTNEEESDEGKPVVAVTRKSYRLRGGVYQEQK